ncbi:DUF937 domain-containing protein [Deinococcus sp. Marseille-Q6407]|uniref:DUF937 domain-containing protein n=1 Tax=Deinococcus sp. Marseille-Q6407 TaxID=2969223 RepID=UPI0021BF963C|nr:DUF937 domain-containing protein [Deinococcus sp. Marseille-Q6407]
MNLQDQFSQFFSNRVLELLSSAVGLTPAQTQSALRAILPRQLDQLAELAGSPQTSANLGDLWAGNDLPQDPEQALATPEGISRLETLGQTLSTRLFSGNASWMNDAAQLAGGNQSAASRLSQLALPLLLAFLGRSGVTAQNAASQLSGMRGALSGMLPAGLGAAASAVTATPGSGTGEIVDSVTAQPGAQVKEGSAVKAATPTPAPQPEPERHLTAAPAPQDRSGCNPLWLLPLLLLAGLAWYLYQNNQKTTDTPSQTTVSESTTSTTTTSAATASNSNEGIVVGSVKDGAELPLEPFVLNGTAPADEVLTITNQNGEILATETADGDGKWEVDMPAPMAGENVYTVTGTPSNAASTFKVQGVGTASGATTSTTSTTSETATAAAPATSSASGTASGGTATEAAVPVTITEPASGANVPAESFTIAGKGQPNASYRLFEDGVNVGTFFADENGAWSADVTAPEPGNRKYVVVNEDGNQAATLPVVVSQPVASKDCSANDVLSLSLDNGDTVSAPFRFGGTGSAKNYTVRVLRGKEGIGKTNVKNGTNCSWSYLSEPGGPEDEVGEITYEVTPEGATAPESTITLNVVQSGVNFKNGEYVGPTARPSGTTAQ